MKSNKWTGAALKGAAALLAAGAVTLTACEDLTIPTADEIADKVVEQTAKNATVENYADAFKDLRGYGEFSVGAAVARWGQDGAAYTLTVDSERGVKKIFLDSAITGTEVAWTGPAAPVAAEKPIAIDAATGIITVAATTNGQSAAFGFTITDPQGAGTIRGTLTVTARYDGDTAGIAGEQSGIAALFVDALTHDNYGYNVAATVTAAKAIASWGQTDAAYTVTVNPAEVSRLYLLGADGTRTVTWNGAKSGDLYVSSGSVYIAAKANIPDGVFTFTIADTAYSDKTIKGTLTVKAAYDGSTVGITSIAPSFLSYLNGRTGVTAAEAVTPIEKWTQTGAAYTVTVNSAETTSLTLPTASYLGTTYVDSVRWTQGGASVTSAAIKQGTDATGTPYAFTIYNKAQDATITGTLTVKTVYDTSTLQIVDIRSKIEAALKYAGYSSSYLLTTTTAISQWGQATPAAYKIDVEGSYQSVYLPTQFSPDSGSYTATIAWKYPVAPASAKFRIAGTNAGTWGYFGGYSYDKYTQYYFQVIDSAADAAETWTVPFVVTYGSGGSEYLSLSGTLTIALKYTKPAPQVYPTVAEQETSAVKAAQNKFAAFQSDNTSSVVSVFADDAITAADLKASGAAAADTKYSIWAKGSGYSVTLPRSLSVNYASTSVTWTLKTDADDILSSYSPDDEITSSYVYFSGTAGKTATLEYTITVTPTEYTVAADGTVTEKAATTKTIKGTLVVTLVDG